MKKIFIWFYQISFLTLLFGMIFSTRSLAGGLVEDEWEFDEITGLIASSYSNSGRLTNGAVSAPGISGNAIYLPPFASVTFPYAQFAFPSKPGKSNFSIRFWLKTTGNGMGNATADVAEVFGNRSGENSNRTPFIDFRLTRSGALSFEITGYNGIGHALAITNENEGKINDGNWHLVTAIRNLNQLQLYIDSKLRATATANDIADIANEYEFAIGANQNAFNDNLPFHGIIDNLKFYSGIINMPLKNPPIERLAAIIPVIVQNHSLPPDITNNLTETAIWALNYPDNQITVIKVLQALADQPPSQETETIARVKKTIVALHNMRR